LTLTSVPIKDILASFVPSPLLKVNPAVEFRVSDPAVTDSVTVIADRLISWSSTRIWLPFAVLKIRSTPVSTL